MAVQEVSSWRELDDAIADPGLGRHEHRVHSTLVFRGLARSSYSHVSSLARLSGEYERFERHLIRNFRKYAHREAPGPTQWDWLSLAQPHGVPTRLLPETLHAALEREGALVFTTEMLADCATDLDELNEIGQKCDDPFVLFFEPPSLDERIVNQAAVLSAFSDARY